MTPEGRQQVITELSDVVHEARLVNISNDVVRVVGLKTVKHWLALLLAEAPQEESPILAFQTWAERYMVTHGRKLTQDEYFITQAAFFAAHPGKGPTSELMLAALPETSAIPQPYFDAQGMAATDSTNDTRVADTQYPSNPFATAASTQTNVATVTPNHVSHEHYYSHWSVIQGIREDERRDPTPKDFADPRFDVLWELLKKVDVHYETGLRSGVTGNDIAAMLNRLDVAVSPAPAPVTPTPQDDTVHDDEKNHAH